ncbi:ParB N-terminal domain-containing protein [Bacillus sp. S17B2]|uniref:HNH endonuclease n=1 Tax=Bacillus sp. S17B2 TaxID=2918907 RepID=UPI0022827E16|nr:ParB N-terminal domain-containing protein [Bacillus sp. S17B2]
MTSNDIKGEINIVEDIDQDDISLEEILAQYSGDDVEDASGTEQKTNDEGNDDRNVDIEDDSKEDYSKNIADTVGVLSGDEHLDGFNESESDIAYSNTEDTEKPTVNNLDINKVDNDNNDFEYEDNGEINDDNKLDITERAKRIKEELEEPEVVRTNLTASLEDSEGNPIEPRKRGTLDVRVISIENDLKQTNRVRVGDQDVYDLQESINRFGLIEPIHVVPFGDYYLLLNGYRRLEACVNLGYTEVPALVDGTIPPTMVKYYEAILNNVKPYRFSEKLKHGKHIRDTQKNVSYAAIEGILGLKAGEFLKALYIDQMKNDFPDVYKQVELGKMTIEQGFKKVEKEVEKIEKEAAAVDQLNSGELDEKLRDKDELADLQIEKQKQTVGDRKVLDPVIRRSVETRDGGYCQCCGFGKGEPDFMGVFNVHHIIPVQYGGSDSKSNLILLCHNCHKLVHDYESGRFTPEQSTFDRRNDVKRIVVLGNMLLRMRKEALHVLRTKHKEVSRQVDKGVLSIGKGLLKAKVDLKGEEKFGESPYSTFKEATMDLDLGGSVKGDLGDMYLDPESVPEVTDESAQSI